MYFKEGVESNHKIALYYGYLYRIGTHATYDNTNRKEAEK